MTLPKEKNMNLFVSHYHKDLEHLPKLKKLLSNKGYNIKDSSMDESEKNNAKNPDYIKSILRPKIKWAGKMIVLIGPETHQRNWVDWEIDYAASFGNKKIIGVYINGASDSDIPESLNKFGDAVVGWDSDKLIDALNGEPVWLDNEGQPRSPFWSDSRSNC